MIIVDQMSAELKWPPESRLVKPDGAKSAVWEHFRVELLEVPRWLNTGKQDKYGELAYCMLCKRDGKIVTATFPVKLIFARLANLSRRTAVQRTWPRTSNTTTRTCSNRPS